MIRFATLVLAAAVASGAVNYSYDGAGRLAKVDYGNGKSIAYTYDKAGNLLSRTAISGGSLPSKDQPSSVKKQSTPRVSRIEPASGKVSPNGSQAR
ncbi:MAG: RHS repeat protein [Acidobacteriota bacterium]|nr:RHS repeat protein [Acidobacteriota bacterium]